MAPGEARCSHSGPSPAGPGWSRFPPHSTCCSYNSVTNCFVTVYAVLVSPLKGEPPEARTHLSLSPSSKHRKEVPKRSVG